MLDSFDDFGGFDSGGDDLDGPGGLTSGAVVHDPEAVDAFGDVGVGHALACCERGYKHFDGALQLHASMVRLEAGKRSGRVASIPVTLFLATWEKPGQTAVEQAWARRCNGGGLRDCLEAGLSACELDPEFLAIGLGSLPNADGELELDAAMIDGRELEAGAVCSLRGIVPAISVARQVMEETPHVMLAGDQARRFAISKGHAVRQTMTTRSAQLYEEWIAEKRHTAYIHSQSDVDDHADTVTMIGWESDGPGSGHLVAASATSGLAWKLPGRVGDSPIVGAGIYADDEIGAAGATGYGEELWKACASFRTVEGIRRGLTPQEACEETIRHMMRRQPHANDMANVVFAADREGRVGAAVNLGTFHLWSCRDGEIEVRAFYGLHSGG